VSPLKDVTSKIGSGSTPRGGKGNYKSSGVSLIRSMNVFDFKFKNDDLAFINNQQAEKLKGVTVYAKDVLLNITGASVARCCIVPAAILPARVNQHVAIIRMIKKRSYYLLYNLCYSEIKKELIGVSESGSTREAITKDDLDNFKITIPNDGVGDLFEDKISLMFSYKITLDEERIRLQKVKDLLLSKMTKVEAEKEIINL